MMHMCAAVHVTQLKLTVCTTALMTNIKIVPFVRLCTLANYMSLLNGLSLLDAHHQRKISSTEILLT